MNEKADYVHKLEIVVPEAENSVLEIPTAVDESGDQQFQTCKSLERAPL